MARAKEIDFSSQAVYTNHISEENIERKTEVVETDNVNDENVFSDMIKDENKEVIIVVRDRKNLSLALRKFKCCSGCLPGPNCTCRKRKDSSGSIVSSCSQNVRCSNCTKSQVTQYVSENLSYHRQTC